MPAWPDCIIAVCHHCLHDFKRNKKEAKDLKPFSSVRSPLSVKIALNFIHHMCSSFSHVQPLSLSPLMATVHIQQQCAVQ